MMSFRDLGAEPVKGTTTRWQEHTTSFMGQPLAGFAGYGVPHWVRRTWHQPHPKGEEDK